jgi:hypothetical protein
VEEAAGEAREGTCVGCVGTVATATASKVNTRLSKVNTHLSKVNSGGDHLLRDGAAALHHHGLHALLDALVPRLQGE